MLGKLLLDVQDEAGFCDVEVHGDEHARLYHVRVFVSEVSLTALTTIASIVNAVERKIEGAALDLEVVPIETAATPA
ncbi:hypothetical protein HBE99_24120 [Mycobacteroides chelonae]|uniref:hypothetical protein n=1 Tax=Mycobacteroides chelonae TaxID=1774 RepID=UPI001910A5BD|nr:hypothetical protein [Mycobacteroides chelonae]QQG99550.1 hypothetical protein HBE99_24120 [Mycobacteroides chelonae]